MLFTAVNSGSNMNYDYFAQMEDGSLSKAQTETEQDFMERILSAVFSEKVNGHSHQFNDRLSPRLCACSAERRSLSVSFCAEEWMLNPNGTLHGGISSTAVDIVMSVLTRFLMKKRNTVTVQLNLNFLKVIHCGETFTVHVMADHAGHRCVMTHAYVTTEASDKPIITATGVLM